MQSDWESVRLNHLEKFCLTLTSSSLVRGEHPK